MKYQLKIKNPILVTRLLVISSMAIVIGLLFINYSNQPTKQPTEVGPTSSDSHKNSPANTNNQQTSSNTVNHNDSTKKPGSSDQSSELALLQFNNQLSPLPDRKVGEYVVDATGVKYPLRVYQTLATPNDPLASQWWVSNVNLSGAWDVVAGSKQTTLAIIDTGFALAHEEFTGRWHQNLGELGASASQNPSILNCSDRGLSLLKSCNLIDDDFDGILDNETGTATRQNPSLRNCTDQSRAIDKSCNLIDDDSNGLIDDLTGWDFVSFYPSSQAGKTNPAGGSVTHGTNVAGVAGATGNNTRGIAGVDWNTKILPLQAINDDGYGDTLTVSRAIRYASDQGADVISLSLGTPFADDYMRQAVAYAISKGSIVVAAAGNDGCDCMVYPARYEEVLAVGASDQSNAKTSFSSYGSTLDILAPGVGMTSPTWSSSNQSTAYVSNIAGTSFSTPLVAGLLSLARSHQPQTSNAQITGVLTETTNRLTIPSSSNRTNSLGYGRVDAMSALSRATVVLSPAQRYTFSPVSGGSTLGSFEPTRSFQVYQCENSRPGSTSVYKLTKGSDIIYTVSSVEAYKAVTLGYVISLISDGFCINLPTDQPQVIRAILISLELENRNPK